MDILCVGDLHLGRRPAHSSVAARSLDNPRDITPSTAWARCVDFAVDRGITAVVLTGDLTEDDKDFFGAYEDLARGVQQLERAGIRVIGVAGNHDHTILPELATAIDGLELLGQGSQWQHTTVTDGRAGIEFIGWSFSAERATSPLSSHTDLPGRTQTEWPRLGLLHCDRDGRDQAYAPVASSTLAASDVEGWLLGHIHKPDDLAARGPNGYLGSVVGLDPTEHGPRGPWLLRVADNGALSMEHVVLAPLRWEHCTLDVSAITEGAQVHRRVIEALKELDREIAAGVHTHPAVVGVRLDVVGESTLRSEIQTALDGADLCGATIPLAATTYFIDRYWFDVRPALDLAASAQHDDPVGLLARRLLLLDDPDSEERQALIERTRRDLDEFRGSAIFARLDGDPTSEAEAEAYLREAGMQALDALIAQESS